MSDFDPIVIRFTVTRVFRDFLNKLARDIGRDRRETLRTACGLLRISQDLKSEGKRLGIVEANGKICEEIEI